MTAPKRLEGRYVNIESFNAELHGPGLWQISGGVENADLWTYMNDGPHLDEQAFLVKMAQSASQTDPEFFAICDAQTGRVAGRFALMNIRPDHRVVEVGHVLYSKPLQGTRAATEAQYLLASYVFDQMQYRRYEWKCNALNQKSRHAAQRLGFQFEGIFRHHMIVKGENRDTAWFSMLDHEWPAIKAGMESWLMESNFTAAGQQQSGLRTLMSRPLTE